jgi:hypothetical protein
MTKAELLTMANELNEMARLLSDALEEGVSDELEISLDDAIFQLESVSETVVDFARSV